ncbi:DUF1902 domain-containing protein [Sphingomonas bacterium]|uniref:DUF1902 domain-containing protein n=1 Tax=Sphingomonas bacterium TaxID=1895847 RepID=UPI0015753C5C|nr:DUF1902 domain-containing protein [Sphingomonas bacterium]
MRDKIELQIHLAFDAEASVWYIAESDIPGLRLEADTATELMRRIDECAEEMIALNEAEIVGNHPGEMRPSMTLRPVFDSPVRLPAYV